MANLLFTDAETVTKTRPTELTETQSDALYLKLAQEIKENNWSNSSIEDIVVDLQTLSLTDTGYEMAKDLESFRMVASYNIDSQFIEWLEDLSSAKENAIRENQMIWVKAHNIVPKLELHTKLLIKTSLNRSQKELSAGTEIYINGFKEDIAYYLVSTKSHSSSNFMIAYERVEANCEPVKN